MVQRQGQRAVGNLTNDDIDQINGRREQLEGKIQERYEIEKDRVKKDIDDWYTRQNWQFESLRYGGFYF